MTLRSAIAIATVAAAAGAALAQQTTTARGVVFLDRNADGARQDGEPGIAGVAVTDSERVVLTDERGNFTLRIDAEDAIISVVKPKGYQVALDAQGLPRGYYIHKPNGSPDDGFAFRGVEPTGPLPGTIAFPLVPVDEPTSFTAIVFGDPQPYSLEQVDFFRAEVIDPLVTAEGNAAGAAFGISLGDLVGDRLDLYGPLNEAQAMLGVPWYNVYGNHDMNFMSGHSGVTQADPDRYADETFERVYGPPNYAFQYGDVHFIVLDNVIWQGFDGYRDEAVDQWPAERQPQTRNYRGGLRDEQIRFIENYLAVVPKDDLVVLAFHIPLEMHGEGVHRVPELTELLGALSSHPRTLSLSGHTHLQQHWFFGSEHGYEPAPGAGPNQHTQADPARFPQPVHHHLNAVTASGSWFNGMRDEIGLPHTTMRDGAPNGYTLVHFDGNRYTTEFRAARQPADHQMNIHLETNASGNLPGELDASSTGEVVVNVFNGVEGDAVEMRIVPNPALSASSMAWTAMRFDVRPDPIYAATHAREQQLPDELQSSWGLPEPRDSHHIWVGDIPAGLPAGTHAVEVRHTDLYGRTHVDRRTFRVK
ncbi:MAG: calcineurin-like phosphoesterase family protein [Planctomycetota bacterium]